MHFSNKKTAYRTPRERGEAKELNPEIFEALRKRMYNSAVYRPPKGAEMTRNVFSQEYLLHAGSEVGGSGSAGGSKGRRSSTPTPLSAIGRSQGSSPGSGGQNR